ISGFLKPSGGEIIFRGARITGAAPHQTFQQGIVQVSQSRDLFPDMTVEDNLRLGAASAGQPGDTNADLENVFASFPRLRERRRTETNLPLILLIGHPVRLSVTTKGTPT